MTESTPPDLGPLEDEIQKCPICDCDVRVNPRYPRYLCRDCASEAASEDGRRLAFANTDFSGGFEAWYTDTKEPYKSNLCYVRGCRCWAKEARFGGIVIQALRPGEERPGRGDY